MKLSKKFCKALEEAENFDVPISYLWKLEIIHLEQEIEKLKLENERLVKENEDLRRKTIPKDKFSVGVHQLITSILEDGEEIPNEPK